jgi:hypothetical protein
VTGQSARWGDERGSLPFAMLISLVALSLSAAIVPIVLTQIGITRDSIERVHALNAAQSGLDAAVGQIRKSTDGTGAGTLAKLPCGPLTGNIGVGGTARYRVVIDYFKVDPSTLTAAQIANTADTTTHVMCVSGAGTPTVPKYALLRSQGTDQATGTLSTNAAVCTSHARCIEATYTVITNNQNIPGGLIHNYQAASMTDLCFDAGSAAPTAGTALRMQPCVEDSDQQKFEYDRSLRLMLKVTETTGTGMCLDAVDAVGAAVVLRACVAVAIPQQRWSFNGGSRFQGTNAANTDFSNNCFAASPAYTANVAVVLADCGTTVEDSAAYSPDALVGAGAAGKALGQLVNYDQFGRCLDVTDKNVAKGFQIAWPCKQSPGALQWNQIWTIPIVPTGNITGVTGTISTNTGTAVYCLVSPGSGALGQYVTLAVCPATATTAMTWRRYEESDTYAKAYRITDNWGQCLIPKDPAALPIDTYGSTGGIGVSKIVVATCTGATSEKWNAPANIDDPSPLQNVTEK